MKDFNHPFDLEDDMNDKIDLFAEELPAQVQHLSDCLSTYSCVGGCISTVACVISTGD